MHNKRRRGEVGEQEAFDAGAEEEKRRARQEISD